jgi:DNA-binding PadR family transcriptional regulator
MAEHDRHPLTLSAKEMLILDLLVHDGELYGLQMVAASKRLKRGTVYVTLGRMEEKGYVASRQEDAPPEAGGLPLRLYRATPLGRRVLAAWTTAARRLMPELARSRRRSNAIVKTISGRPCSPTRRLRHMVRARHRATPATAATPDSRRRSAAAPAASF